MKCTHCNQETKELTKGYCKECYPLYCCEDCGDYVDDQNKLCDDCWDEG